MSDYTRDSIQILTGLQAVRKRPAMYVGSLDSHGVNNLAFEFINNTFDEHLAGHATTLHIDTRGPIVIQDDGRGIPTRILLKVFTELHHGSTYDGHSPHVHLNAYGLGVAVPNALSSVLRVRASRDGSTTELHFERGELIGQSPPTDATSSGTWVSFEPDPEIFGDHRADLRPALVEAAWMLPDLKMFLNDEDLSQPSGLVGRAAQHGPATIHQRSNEDCTARLIRAPDGEERRVWLNLRPIEGGRCVEALQSFSDGTVFLDIRHRNPQYDGRTKSSVSDPVVVAWLEEWAGCNTSPIGTVRQP